MALLIQREILAAEYARRVRIGDRAGAKAIAAQLRQIVAQILTGAAW